VGGVARRATLIKQEQERGEPMLLLDAGDGLVRDQAPATESGGKSSIELMNMMGYDAMALGEGDLAALGPETIAQRMAEANFPILSANVTVAETGELLAQPYALLDVGGRQMGVIGLTGQAAIPGVEIAPPIDAARSTVKELGGQVDVIILLSHAGLQVNRQIAAEAEGVDLIVSGGSDGFTDAPEVAENGTVIVHADLSSTGHAGRRIGVGSWHFDAQGRLTAQGWERVTLGPEFIDDPEMAAWVEAHR
jgi:5'-nucleotidase/UDP-sugar diphosphatase